MTITKDIWMTLTAAQKQNKMQEALEQLDMIETGKHPLSNRVDQGRLSGVRKDIEKFVISALSWESDRQTQRHHI
jgi:hypothetical protein